MRKKGSGKRGRYRASHFMDVALEAYIREVSLSLLRDVMAMVEDSGFSMAEAVKTAEDYLERGPYSGIWKNLWRSNLVSAPPGDHGELFTRIEETVKEAVLQEQQERQKNDDPTIEDTSHYKGFIERAMGQLLEEASGEIEELD